MNSRTETSQIKAGLFVLGAVLVFVVGSLWIVGASILKYDQQEYQVLLKNSQGIKKGDRVRYAGVRIGRVQEIDLRPDEEWPVRFVVAIDPNLPIYTDATARFSTTSLLGSSFLEISPGSRNMPVLPPGGEIYGTETLGLTEALGRLDMLSGKAFELMTQTNAILAEVTHDIGPILHQVRGFLTDESAESVRVLLQSARGTLEEVQPEITGLVKRLNTIAARIEPEMEEISGMSRSASDLLQDLRAAIGPDGARLSVLLESAGNSLDAAAVTLQIIAGRGADLDATLGHLRDIASNLQALSQILKERPFSLIRIKPEKDRRPGEGGR